MAGGHTKYRHLSRNASQRKALLRGLVTQLVEHESIHTSYAKAKEAQRMAEKLITLAKRNNEPCRRSAQGILYTPHRHLPKLFGELRDRYMPRVGGYTRVVRTETIDPISQFESAILEFVDGPRDTRFMMAAKTVARERLAGQEGSPLTAQNVKKATQFRGAAAFEIMVKRFMELKTQKELEAPGEIDVGRSNDAEAERMAAEEERAAIGVNNALKEGGQGDSRAHTR